MRMRKMESRPRPGKIPARAPPFHVAGRGRQPESCLCKACVPSPPRMLMSGARCRPIPLPLRRKCPLWRGDPTEQIFGHNIFTNHYLTFEPNVNMPTPADYRLGPGDEVIIDVWGCFGNHHPPDHLSRRKHTGDDLGACVSERQDREGGQRVPEGGVRTHLFRHVGQCAYHAGQVVAGRDTLHTGERDGRGSSCLAHTGCLLFLLCSMHSIVPVV